MARGTARQALAIGAKRKEQEVALRKPAFGFAMAATVVVAVLSSVTPAAGQNPQTLPGGYGGDPNAPPTRKPSYRALPDRLIAPERLPNGQPNLQGAWRFVRQGGPEHSLEFGIDPGASLIHGWNRADREFNTIVEPKDGKIPYRPGEMAARLRENLTNIYAPTKVEHISGRSRCLLYGVPQTNVMGATIRQTDDFVVFVHPGRNTRIIPLDGRPRLPERVKLYNGESRAHFEGNTLVIETTNNNDETWFDEDGTFHSDQLRVVERLTMVSANEMHYEVTVEDPVVFSQSWKLAVTWDRAGGADREWEDECYAWHERSFKIMLEAGRRAVAAGVKGIHNHDSAEGSYAPTQLRSDDPK